MICPKCGKVAVVKSNVRPLTTTAGIGAGGYMAAAGAKTGAAIGACLGPLGSLAGGLLGVLIGAAAGGTAGNVVGKYVDEGIVRMYRCCYCGWEWRAA